MGGVKRHWDGSITAKINLTKMEKQFMMEAESRGMLGLAGHPAFGGMRVCLYNGVPDDAVKEVARFMQEFAAVFEKKAASHADGPCADEETALDSDGSTKTSDDDTY